jgi:electron-transferring-flavoprotein dehydrogenase
MHCATLKIFLSCQFQARAFERRYCPNKSQILTFQFADIKCRHKYYSTITDKDPTQIPRDSEKCDVLIVGGGPSGLCASIRLKQLAEKHKRDLRVCLLEKGANIGNHILSGAVIEPRALNELFPDWKERGAPLNVPVTEDALYFLTKSKKFRLPTISLQRNHGNYIVSLANVCRWLAEQAQSLGVEIYSGFAGAELLFHDDGSVKGVATGDLGLDKNGKPTENFQRGLELHAPITLLAEGCRGSLSKILMHKFKLREGADPQTYGIGLKELWEIPAEKHRPGTVIHTMGWPVDLNTWGGAFIYHMEKPLVAVGYVIGLDYTNPYLNPYKEFQRWKHHPFVANLLEGGKCIGYGARALNEGGLQSIPKLVVPGAALIGCAAGFLNVPKIKGSHNAMKSGMVAAEAVFDVIKDKKDNAPIVLNNYPEMLKKSWLWQDLYRVRNIRPAFTKFGTLGGILYTGLDWLLFHGKEPWTLHHSKEDYETLKLANECKPIEYPKPDGKLSFDLMTNLIRSGTNHNHNQPPHLKLRDPNLPLAVNLPLYDGPETRYCPAGVYEYVEIDGKTKFQINAQNCLHCKTCDIKDPKQNIYYTTPEGGGGPAYGAM